MHQFLPPSVTKDVYALLQVLADPAQYKTALDGLKAHADAAQQAADDAREAHKAAEVLKAQAKQHEAGAVAAASAAAAAHDVREKQLADHGADLAKEQSRLQAWDAAVSDRESAAKAAEGRIKERETAAAARAAEVNAREAGVAKAEAEAKAIRADLDQRHAAFVELAKPRSYAMTAETGKLGANFNGGV